MARNRLLDRTVVAIVTLAVVAAAATFAQAMFMQPTDAPVDRLLDNAEAYVKENPKDASGYYVLGRIHYLAFSSKVGLVPVWRMPAEDEAAKPQVVSDTFVGSSERRRRSSEATRRALSEFGIDDVRDIPHDKRRAFWERQQAINEQLAEEDWKPAELDEAAVHDHATKAIANFEKAIELDGDNGLYHLGLASVLDEYSPIVPHGQKAVSERELMRRRAMREYAKAFELTRKQDAAREERPLEGLTALVSYNAAKAYLANLRADGKPIDDPNAEAMAKHLRKLKDLPIGAVTPIVFSFESHERLGDLLDNDAAVAFDLDGTGRPQTWRWVKPTTGILVWDPADDRRITSGRQLFGSVTWWLLPGDGYRAMDLLDDDRDGELADDELRGLAVWFDRNGDGMSDRGEVVPIDQTPVAGLAVTPRSRDGQALMHPRGLRLNDGTHRPTYDWIAEPASSSR